MKDIIDDRKLFWRPLSAVVAAVCTICFGLALRAFGYKLGLSFFAVKYGGSLLWGAMVYLIFAACLPRARRLTLVGFAIGFSICVELIRLYHTPWLDAFRATTLGLLLLGKVFSIWNVVAYAAGIAAAAVLDQASERALQRSVFR